MTEHTPGPWIHMNDAAALRQGILRDGPGAHQLVGKVGRWWILAPRDPHGWSDGDEEADARLIAAAPDLLAACSAAAKAVEAMIDRIDEQCADVDCICTMRGKTPHSQTYRDNELAMLNAAIAKARGHDAGGE